MRSLVRRLPAALLPLLVFAACAGPAPSPSSSATPAPSVSPSEPASPSASSATATASPTLAPTPAGACPIAPQTGRLPSDRMVNVTLTSLGSSDVVTFVFDDPSLPDPPQGPSEGALDAAEPPFTHGASGLELDVTGEHVAMLRFSGMSLSNDIGEPTYDGVLDFRPDFAALRSVVNFDLSEGVIGWYIGFDGNGCLTLESTAEAVNVVIAHPTT